MLLLSQQFTRTEQVAPVPMTAPRKSENKERMTGYNPAPTVQDTSVQGNYEWRGKEQRERTEVGRAMLETQD